MSAFFDICDTQSVKEETWGTNCSHWTLMEDKNLVVMQEKMPPGTQDELHYHEQATQFVYVLRGELQLDMNGKIVTLASQQGLAILPKIPHRVINNSKVEAHFLLISAPGHTEDRVLVK